MAKLDTKHLVQITAHFEPEIKTFAQAKKALGGRRRQQIEKMNLTFGVVLNDKKVKECGVKVIVVDDKYNEAIRHYKELDSRK